MPVRKKYQDIKDTYLDLVIVLVVLLGILVWLYLAGMSFFFPAIGIAVCLFTAYYILKPRYCSICSKKMKIQLFDDRRIVLYCDSCEVKITLKVKQGED